MAKAGDEKGPAQPPDSKSVLKWQTTDVAAHIRSLNPAFGAYAKAFEDDAVDGQMLLHDIDDEWLALHITNVTHRKRIKREIVTLRPGQSTSLASADPSLSKLTLSQLAAAVA